MKDGTSGKDLIKNKVIIYELIIFFVVIQIIWLDEIFDFPHYIFGAPKTLVNPVESIIETCFVLIAAIYTIFISNNFLEKINYLEGFLRVCTFCKKINFNNEWVPIDIYLRKNNSKTKLSHGLCDECMKKHYNIEQ